MMNQTLQITNYLYNFRYQKTSYTWEYFILIVHNQYSTVIGTLSITICRINGNKFHCNIIVLEQIKTISHVSSAHTGVWDQKNYIYLKYQSAFQIHILN